MEGITNMNDEKKAARKTEIIRGLKFTLFSAGAGLIQLSSTLLLDEVLHVASHIAYLIGLILSVLFNFTVNRRYTFRSAANVPIAMLKVALFYAVFTPTTTALDYHLTQTREMNSTLVLIGIMLLNFVLEFAYCQFFVYRGKLDTNELAKRKNEPQQPI